MGDQFGRDPHRDAADSHGHFGGLWEGVVIDDKDPNKIGRVKVRIFDLHDDDTPLENIDWCPVNYPGAGASQQNPWACGGMFHPPAVDALVNVMFKHADPRYPVVMGGWWPVAPGLVGREVYGSNGQRKALYNTDGQPTCPTWRSVRGHVIEFDDDIGELRITSSNGHKVTLSDGAGEQGDSIKLEDHEGNYLWMNTGRKLFQLRWDGDYEEHITGKKVSKIGGNLVQEVGGDLSYSTDGKTNIFGGGILSIDALPMINLNCGIATDTPANPLRQGKPSAGDYVPSVLARLGNVITKIVTGS